MKNICKNIQGKRQLEESIPQLFNCLVDNYQVMAEVRLAMHYFTLYETFYDDEDTWSSEMTAEIGRINLFIRDDILKSRSGEDREASVHFIDNLRKSIMRRMDTLAAYADVFQIYEYVLNRVEYRYRNDINTVDDTEFARDILQYVFDSEDNLIINEKIRDIIGQLPVRMTKQRYFEIIKESLASYLGAESSSLDTFLYMLRTSAMLYHEEGMETLYQGLWEKKEYLSRLDYKGLSQEEYEKAVSVLKAATLTLETEISVCFGLQEITNEVYAMLLCGAYSGLSFGLREETEKSALAIIHNINEIFISQEKIEPSKELLDRFTALEGVQEELSYEADTLENALFEVENNQKPLIESLMVGKFLNVLKRTQGLLSNSLFIDFDDRAAAEAVDEKRIITEAATLENEMRSVFEAQDRMITRAVMANTINKVPVFFKNHTEVMDYVLYSLERCTDKYEKAASVEIINEIMSE